MKFRKDLYQNYPNPFNPVTKIKFDLPRVKGNSSLKVEVYNVNGELVTELLNTDYAAGRWELSFDATNLASGIYFYKISASQFNQTRKMILVK
jgi:flagellar hook assembly protein FlgD